MKIKYPVGLALVGSLGLLLVTSVTVLASATDDRIESAAKKSYVFKTYLKDDSIKTESKDGVVVLTGSVAHASHRSLAEDTVENLPGVKSVDNQLKIVGDTSEERSDGWLSTKVKSTLLFHRHVSAGATDVYVKEGVVSLRGVATSQAQKELAGEYAADIEGVKEVKNEMTVKVPPSKPDETLAERIDDASITAQVKSTLLHHRSTSALKTKVVTKLGVVTLTGIAKNEAEKSLVTKLVSDVHGVKSVVNQLTIEVPVVLK
jgi:hyperosmotically inducible protein